jgi:hypothetical protein
MNQQTQTLLVTLLVLLVAIVQFFLRSGPQNDRVKELEIRLEQAEQALEDILQRLESLV